MKIGRGTDSRLSVGVNGLGRGQMDRIGLDEDIRLRSSTSTSGSGSGSNDSLVLGLGLGLGLGLRSLRV